MTAVDTTPGLRRRLSRLWRTRLTPEPPAITPPPSPEEAPVGHIYISDQPELGQATTALGRYMTGEHLLVKPAEIPGDQTQVIRVPKPRLTDAEAALDPGVEVDDDALRVTEPDPPIYLRTLAEVQQLRALPPAPDQPAKEGDLDA